MKVYVSSLNRERDYPEYLSLTVDVYGTSHELERFREQLHFSRLRALEPLKVRQEFGAYVVGALVMNDEGETLADCTTQEAAEAALRLLK